MEEQLRILILEDTNEDAALIEIALIRAGMAFAARRVESRDEFLRALDEFSPHLILADCDLPAFDARAALETTKVRTPDIPVIITGALDDKLAADLLRDGAHDYILKERLSQLAPAVRRAIEEVRNRSQRREAEKALYASEERFRLAMKGTNDGLWDWDLRSDAVYYSPRWKSMLGYAEDELANHLDTWKSLTHPDDIARVLARVQDLIEGRADTYEVEFRMRHKDGQHRDILSRGFLLRDPAGDAIRLIGTHVDLTEHEWARERIVTLSRLYATSSACNSAVVRSSSRRELCEHICRIATDTGGWAAAWIGFLDETTGRIAPEAWSKSMDPFIHRMVVSLDPALPEGKGPTSIAARTGEPYFCNDVFTDPNTLPWRTFLKNFGVASAAAVPLRVEDRFAGVINLYSERKDFYTPEVQSLLNELSHDISFGLDSFVREQRRRHAEGALAESEAKYRGLVEQSIAGTYIIQDGNFVYVNPRFAEIFGYGSPEELIGRDVLSLVAEKERGTVAENIRRRIDGEVASISYEFTGLRQDGAMVDVGVHGARATHRGRSAVIGMMQDISGKKRAEEQIHRYVAQIENAFNSTVRVVTTLGEMRDPYTAGHQRRVAEIAVAIGAELGFDARRQEGLRVAGYLHDVGKITIPSEILSKPGKLSAAEFRLVQGHAQASYDVLKDVEFPWPVAAVALQHHERMDGSGYPQGLRGEAILLEARIIAVADVIEAMSSDRPYRAGLGIETALAEIERGRGSQYDADITDVSLRLFRERRYRLPA